MMNKTEWIAFRRVFDVPTHVASRQQQLLVSELGLSKGVLQEPLSDVQNAVATPFISDNSSRKSHHAHRVGLDFDFDQVHCSILNILSLLLFLYCGLGTYCLDFRQNVSH